MLQITAIGLISVGIVFVLLLGEIDLSVGAVSGLCGRGDGGPQRQARLEPLPLDRRRRSPSGRRSALLQGCLFTRFTIPSFVVTLAGLLAWQGALLQVLGATGTINLTDPKITGLANTFYRPTVGWVHRRRRDRRLRRWSLGIGHRRRVAAGLAGASPSALLVFRFVLGRRGRRSSPSRSSTPTAACPWRC